ncbi:MAG: TetR/AcrR family transcriptional regulator [Jatrophihabitans sp.]|uniref:TetR/AcrR family transcriptional regulator n=1 Tax=Jatrophihabitans sp. TaxID=1932789 RepID=UPI003F804A4A
MQPVTARRRLEPDERREQILEAAMRLFGERPYAAVSTTDLALEAGVTRGLLHHYFGTKRDLYVEVVRNLVILPRLDDEVAATASTLEERAELCVDWFLGVLGTNPRTFVAVLGAEGVGDDPEIEQILAEADDLAARKVLKTLGVRRPTAAQRAAIRAYGGMLKVAVRETVRERTLTRRDLRSLLVTTLIAVAREVLPPKLT